MRQEKGASVASERGGGGERPERAKASREGRGTEGRANAAKQREPHRRDMPEQRTAANGGRGAAPQATSNKSCNWGLAANYGKATEVAQ